MRYAAPLVAGRLQRRYKRFLADVTLDDGAALTCHCPNTGSMLGCAEPGLRVWLSASDRPGRKYRHTWEQVETREGVRVGIHTGRTNALVREAIDAGRLLPELGAAPAVRAEVPVPGAPMRADFRLEDADGVRYVEVKNVTAAVEAGIALFPDAPSSRGVRHLEVLTGLVRAGGRAALVFCAQREDATEVRPADAIDPAYGRALREAIAAGVEVLALGARVEEHGIRADRRLPVVCP
ncbi:DNA/RNA nuclease SfsA [Sediminicurvatus halobius]|uniref:Sugar fermentation stimulation protein homolog n=1 Tax=Sediminicurvatus halobius TaxID=2182432 RepID=A0A2U2N2B4_9GAMM|nr:DNA/RNA nuclease SfsA [Spiribacter halobius]PWG63222.1 DNA/RNA nuclease SfsA [Spiribacter halobius]UEX76708.1 DNA/RNA nuclease SfsA [Spiribacter halobius]